jgi:hypothetical protein
MSGMYIFLSFSTFISFRLLPTPELTSDPLTLPVRSVMRRAL